jgi:hypothetical protein
MGWKSALELSRDLTSSVRSLAAVWRSNVLRA